MALYELAPERRICLEFDDWSVDQWPENSGNIGRWERSSSIGYCFETLLRFDVSQFVNSIINSVRLKVVCDQQGSQDTPAEMLGHVWRQNKLEPGYWSSPPRWDDFSSSPWTTEVANPVEMKYIDTYYFESTQTFIDLINTWKNNSADNWGLVLSWNGPSPDYWLHVSNTSRLIIDADEISNDDYVFKNVNRGVYMGVNNGIN